MKNTPLSLITGGAGFIGSNLARTLLRKGHKIIVFDNFSSGSINNLKDFKKQIKIVKGDVTNFKALLKTMKGVDYVYHHAALVSVAESMAKPQETHKINLMGTSNVLEAARLCGVKKVLLASSSAVYGNGRKMPYKEDYPTDCRSPYAATKLMGEELLKTYYKSYGLNTVIVRYFNVFGPGQAANSPYAAVIAKFIDNIKKGTPLNINGDGKQTRDFVFIDDVVNATLLVMKKGKSGEIYNIASGKSYTLLTLVSLLENITGKKINRIFKSVRLGDVKKSSANIAKIKNLGFTPSFSFENALEVMFNKSSAN